MIHSETKHDRSMNAPSFAHRLSAVKPAEPGSDRFPLEHEKGSARHSQMTYVLMDVCLCATVKFQFTSTSVRTLIHGASEGSATCCVINHLRIHINRIIRPQPTETPPSRKLLQTLDHTCSLHRTCTLSALWATFVRLSVLHLWLKFSLKSYERSDLNLWPLINLTLGLWPSPPTTKVPSVMVANMVQWRNKSFPNSVKNRCVQI